MQPLAQLPAVCATGLAAAAAWSSVLSIWTNPILIDETGTILAGHGRLEGRPQLALLASAALSGASADKMDSTLDQPAAAARPVAQTAGN